MTDAVGFTSPSPIRPGFDLSGFDCGKPDLDNWLRNRALKNEGHYSRTFLVTAASDVAGFYCLSAGAIERERMPGALRRNAPDAIPVAVLGRLAVSRRFGSRGLGRSLLADALSRIGRAAETLGLAAVLVHALDESARGFYLSSAEFTEYPASSRTLYLPIRYLQ